MAIDLAASNFDRNVEKALKQIVGNANVSTSSIDRLNYGRDLWPLAVLWIRENSAKYFPDYIVWPEDPEQIQRIFLLAENEGIPVTPYGAGSGVCAGALPLRGGIVIDTKKMNRIVNIDFQNQIAEMETGIIGQKMEKELNYHGYTMGHFPSSIYCSTLGGYLAARSAGQMSSLYGKIEDMVISLEAVLPNGQIIRTPPAPCRNSFSDVNQLIVGSEGVLGVITKAWMRIHPLPEKRTYQGFKFKEVEDGLEAMREIMQTGLKPAVLRLYDEFDTMVFKSHANGEVDIVESLANIPMWRKIYARFKQNAKSGSLGQILRHPALINRFAGVLPGGCLLIIIFEGEAQRCRLESEETAKICLRREAVDLGEAPGKAWMTNRYNVSYKQSGIFDSGAFVDTMETAAPWSQVGNLYRAVCRALANKVFIMAHFSHAYPDGCCIYFSFVGTAPDNKKIQNLYHQTWETALDTVHCNAGTISHHHGIGIQKASFLHEEIGGLMKYFERLKRLCDPEGLLNPGKMGF